MQKLMISKQIMDKHNNIARGNATPSQLSNSPDIQSFDLPQAKYNIPQEFLQESQSVSSPVAVPRENTKPVGVPSVDAIRKSKLPDEIKKLMEEHPISQPQQPTVGLSNDLIEKASRLMKEQSNNYVPESASVVKPKKQINEDSSDIKKLIKEAVEESLKKHGIIAETSEKTNEIFSFKVGKHIFEGKITKVKKIP